MTLKNITIDDPALTSEILPVVIKAALAIADVDIVATMNDTDNRMRWTVGGRITMFHEGETPREAFIKVRLDGDLDTIVQLHEIESIAFIAP